MFSVCELCDVVVEKVFVEEEQEYGCESCWEAYGEIHQALPLPLDNVRPIDQDNTMNEKLSVSELEELIFKIDLMIANPSELFTTPEQD